MAEQRLQGELVPVLQLLQGSIISGVYPACLAEFLKLLLMVIQRERVFEEGIGVECGGEERGL